MEKITFSLVVEYFFSLIFFGQALFIIIFNIINLSILSVLLGLFLLVIAFFVYPWHVTKAPKTNFFARLHSIGSGFDNQVTIGGKVALTLVALFVFLLFSEAFLALESGRHERHYGKDQAGYPFEKKRSLNKDSQDEFDFIYDRINK
ncbi:MAG: hypothetical protein QM526_01455 [Alphaproteobacteria bacterium]|nr:hypothetical protein [Alphaproteobacteria bacterium]